MIRFTAPQAMMISIDEATVEALLRMKRSPDESIDSVIKRNLGTSTSQKIDAAVHQEKSSAYVGEHHKYSGSFLEEPLFAQTLPEFFALIIDKMDSIAPEILEDYSKYRSSGARKFIAQERSKVHTHNPYLPTMKTKSDWHISKNVSHDQIVTALKKLCTVAKLKFGKDICFPLTN